MNRFPTIVAARAQTTACRRPIAVVGNPCFAPCRRARFVRRGFSLAEMMIAIGILGIGMLMVAATFPVGIQQTQTNTYETVAPLVANDAWGVVNLALDRRLPVSNVMLRDALSITGHLVHQVGATRYLKPYLTDRVCNEQGVFEYTVGQTGNIDRLPNLNDWLQDDTLANGRGYPSGAANYTWRVLFWNPPGANGEADLNRLEVVLLVLRRELVSDLVRNVTLTVNPSRRDEVQVDAPSADAIASLGTGYSLLSDNGEELPRVVRILEAGGKRARVQLERDPGNIAVGWLVPKDPNTGMSPLLRTYRRTILLP